MAIVLDNVSTAGAASALTLSWTHTVGAVSVYTIAGSCAVAGGTLSSMTIAGLGVGLKSVLGQAAESCGQMWDLPPDGPGSGTRTMSAAVVGAVARNFCVGVITYTGAANAFATVAAMTVAAATVVDLSISCVAGNLCVGFMGCQSVTATTVTTPVTQNERFRITTSNAFLICADSTAVASTCSLSWGLSVATAAWAFGIPISATAVAVTDLLPSLQMLGAGQ